MGTAGARSSAARPTPRRSLRPGNLRNLAGASSNPLFDASTKPSAAPMQSPRARKPTRPPRAPASGTRSSATTRSPRCRPRPRRPRSRSSMTKPSRARSRPRRKPTPAAPSPSSNPPRDPAPPPQQREPPRYRDQLSTTPRAPHDEEEGQLFRCGACGETIHVKNAVPGAQFECPHCGRLNMDVSFSFSRVPRDMTLPFVAGFDLGRDDLSPPRLPSTSLPPLLDVATTHLRIVVVVVVRSSNDAQNHHRHHSHYRIAS